MTNNTQKIYTAIHNILKEMQVEKNGTLPSHMGNAKYATAEAISNATKKLFVENQIILVPEEEILHIDNPDFGDKKMRFQITVKGSYKAIHIEDGSSITFSGLGQGIATGTAVATNIASTFALKNALQRMFLISEDNIDMAGQVEQAQPRQHEAQRRANNSAPKRPNSMGEPPIVKEINAVMEEKGINTERIAEINRAVAKELGVSRSEALPEVLKRLKSGEIK